MVASEALKQCLLEKMHFFPTKIFVREGMFFWIGISTYEPPKASITVSDKSDRCEQYPILHFAWLNLITNCHCNWSVAIWLYFRLLKQDYQCQMLISIEVEAVYLKQSWTTSMDIKTQWFKRWGVEQKGHLRQDNWRKITDWVEISCYSYSIVWSD